MEMANDFVFVFKQVMVVNRRQNHAKNENKSNDPSY